MKKKLNIALIIFVTALWGTVGYRFVRNYFFQESITMAKTEAKVNLNNLYVKRDTFLLEVVARDPFLNKVSPIAKESATRPARVNNYNPRLTNKVSNGVPALWPDVSYFGFIKSGNSKEVALVKINGTLFRLHKGESKDGILVKSVYKDSVNVTFKKEKRNFLRQKGIFSN